MKKTVQAKIVHPNDVEVLAPPAQFKLLNGSNSKELEKMAKQVSPLGFDEKDIIKMQQAEIRELESDLQKTRMVTANIANAALCLYKLLLDHGFSKDGDRVILPKELVERMSGQKISIGDDESGNRFIRVQSQVPYPTWEGRTED